MRLPNEKNWKRYFFIMLIILVGVGIAWRVKSDNSNKKVDHAVIERKTVRETLTLSGSIDAHEHVTIQFQTAGLLSWVGVKEGDRVKKYQAIASLDVRSTKKTLEKYLKTYMDTRWTFDQTKDDNGGKAISDRLKRLLDQSQFTLDKSVLDVEVQALAIEFATITTPIDGIVTRVDAPYPGVNITAAGAQFEVVNPDTMYFQLNADQTDVVKLHEGDRARITLDAFIDAPIDGTISRISFVSKSGESGTVYQVDMKIATISSQLRLGLTGDAMFTTKQKENVLAVPPKFIKKDAKGTYLLVGDKRQKEYIKTGIEGENVVEIDGAVATGNLVYD